MKLKKRELLQPWLYSNRIPHFHGEVQYVQVKWFCINFGVGGGIVECDNVLSCGCPCRELCGGACQVLAWAENLGLAIPSQWFLPCLPPSLSFLQPRGEVTPYQMDINLRKPRLWHLYTLTLSFLPFWVGVFCGLTWHLELNSCVLRFFTLFPCDCST